ncbi:MAG: YrhA family protein, partial [Firmicutes bacterium]|nr:YrhA family protein [Bacillota bacterium]
DIPKEYAEIFKVFNGIEFNGSIIYGIDYELLNEKPVLNENPVKINGLIENNKIWYENSWQKKYIFLGEGNISWYVYDTQLSEYCELDKPSGERINRYDKAESLLDKIFEDMLI